MNLTDITENFNLLSALEKDLSGTTPLLACYHCLALQPRRDFDLDRRHSRTPPVEKCDYFYEEVFMSHQDLIQRQRGDSIGRTCNVIYGKIHLGYHRHLSWTDMQEFARNSSRTE